MGTNKTTAASRPRGTKYLAIDIDPEGLLVVSGSAGAAAARVEHAYAWLPGNDHGPPALTAQTAKALGEALRDRLKAAGIPAGPVLVGIGRDRVILKELKYPPVDAENEPALVRFQAMKEIAESPDEIVLDYAPLADSGLDGSPDRRATAVVVNKEFYNAIQTMVAAAGWKLAAVTPRPFAIAAGLSEALAHGKAQPLPSPNSAAAVVSLSKSGGEFTVVRNGNVTFTRAISGPSIGNESLLLGEIRRNLTTYNGQNTNQPIEAVYVPEAENTLGGWAGRLEDSLTIPIYAYDPVATAAEPLPEKMRGRFAGAAGLLAGRAVGLPINFASPRSPQAKSDPRKPMLIAAAIAAAVLIFGGGIFGYVAVSAADGRLEAKKQEKADLEKLLADSEPDGKRIAAAEQWKSRSVNYLDELFDMSDRMPASDTVRVNKLVGTAIRVDKTGKQTGQANLVLAVGAKNPTAASELVTAIDRDNTRDRKFYSGTLKTTGGSDKAVIAHRELATITTIVMHRSPSEYTRFPTFYVPRRGVIPTVVEPKKLEMKTEDPVDEEFP